MKALSLVSLIAGIVCLVIAVIGRILFRPISIIAPNVPAAAYGQLSSILFLLSIAAALQEKKKKEE